MKILTIFTGGTIASSISDDYISLDASKKFRLIWMYEQEYEKDTVFECAEPYFVLSENMNCQYYKKLSDCVFDNLEKDYDGIIITHGSDTLQYTAAALSYILGNDTIPVVLVASNYVLDDKRANGLHNFYGAVELIRAKAGRGVFVSYENSGECIKIHRGYLTMPHEFYSDELKSLDGDIFGTVDEKGFTPFAGFVEKENILPTGILECSVEEQSMVQSLVIQPGMMYPVPNEKTKYVLLLPYHSGTACTDSRTFREYIRQLNERGIKIYLVGAKPDTDYDSCKKYEEMGIIPVGNASPCAFYIRLWLDGLKDIKKGEIYEKKVGK